MRISLGQIILFSVGVIVLSICLFPSGREMGLFYYKSKNYEPVESYLARQFHEDPRDLANAFRYLMVLNETGKFELLETEAQKLLEVYPEDFQIHQFMAKFYEDRMIPAKACRHWLKIRELKPAEEEIIKKIAYYYLSTKNYPALIELYEEELALHPNHSELYYDLASFYALVRNLTKTKQVYELLVKNFPSDIEAKQELAQVLEIMGHAKEAVSLYRQIAQQKPDSEYHGSQLLEKLLYYREEKEALELTRELMGRFSDARPFLAVLSGFFSEIQTQPEWLDILEKLHRLQPNEPIALRLLGEIYYNENNFFQALVLLKKLHDLDQCDYYSHYLMANIYEGWAQPSEAKAEYQLALKHLERYAHRYGSVSDKLIKAQILRKLGKRKESLLVLNLILLREPNNVYALELSAGNYMDLRRMPFAKERLEKLSVLKPDDSELLRSLSEIYIKMGDYNQAQQTLRSYHEKTGGDYRSYHLYGNVLSTLGDDIGSQRAYSEALRLIQSADR